MAEELTIVMEPLIDEPEIVVIVTKEAQSLNPLILPCNTKFEDLRRKVQSISRLTDVHMLYIDEQGDAVSLDDEEFAEAWKLALANRQLHVMAQPPLKTCTAPPRPPPCSKPPKTNTYAHLAACIGDDRRKMCEKAAKALLGKAPCEGDAEPMWFSEAMQKHTDEVINAIIKGINGAVITSIRETTPTVVAPPIDTSIPQSLVVHNEIVCDGCEKLIVGVRYKCGNCPDYDLCEGCEVLSLFIHKEDHAFIKIKRPAKNAGVSRKGERKPLLKKSIYSSPAMILVPHPKEEPIAVLKFNEQKESGNPPCEGEEEGPVMIRRSKDKLREDLKGTKHYRKHHHHHHRQQKNETTDPEPTGFEPSDEMVKKTKKQVKRDLHEARRKKRMENEGNTEEVSTGEGCVVSASDSSVKVVPEENEVKLSTGNESGKGHGKCLGARFVEDTSYPDDSVVYYGKPFEKGWVVENNGTKTWKKVKLVYQNGFHPEEPELDVPELEPGQQAELIATFPAIGPSDGIQIKTSWRLIHDGHTPFGDILWLSVIAQPDPTEEMSGTFELITYPTLPRDLDDPSHSIGFSHGLVSSNSLGSSHTGEGYTMVDPPTPVMSLASNDSLFNTQDNEEQEQDDDEESDSMNQQQCSGDEFVVVIPDCFKLDIPLTDFEPPDPISPEKENIQTPETTELQLSEKPHPPPHHTSTNREPEPLNDFEKVETPPAEEESPNTIRRRLGFGRETLDAAWASRSRNPLRYALGAVNTVADLVDQHVHFSNQATPTKPQLVFEELVQEKDEETEEEVETTEDVPHPSAPPLPIPTPPSLSDINCQDPNIVHAVVSNKWEGPKPPDTPMDRLITMGFANRALNSRLLKKYNNNLQEVIQELVDTSGDGYQNV